MAGGASKLAVILASRGRPDELADAVEALKAQSFPADAIFLSVTEQSDLPKPSMLEGTEILFGAPGLCAQRNTALERVLGEFDIIAFLDDDYLPAVDTLERIQTFFAANPDVVGTSGHLLADGINGPGISIADAKRLLLEYENNPVPDMKIVRELNGLYGCNMVYRANAIGSSRFDEALPLYGWQEDVDFSNRLKGKGRLVATNAFAGVHRGVKRSRTSGIKLGYSQIANVLYLQRKQTIGKWEGFKLIIKNVTANHVKSLRPEPWIDRSGRVVGNWKAIGDLISGRLHPTRILDF